MHIPSLMKIHWIYARYRPETKIRMCLGANSSVKNGQNLPFSNRKPDLQSINAHTKFGENPLIFTQVIVPKGNYGWTDLSNPKPDLHNISTHTKFGKFHLPVYLLKQSSRNANTDRQMKDEKSYNRRTDIIMTDRWTDTQMQNMKPYHPNTIMWQGIKNIYV